jgi:4'-phosphopantetheinyl transferase
MSKNIPSIVLVDNEVHLWIAKVDTLFEYYSIYNKLLDDREQAKKNKFVFCYLKKRYAITHGILRDLLSNYLNVTNEKICLSYSDFGKPHLKYYSSGLKFNLSHSGEIAIFGLAKNIEVGVDIEQVRNTFNEGVREYVLSESEKSTFDKLRLEEKQLTFLNIWTCKEAILKALGTGLSKSMADIELTLEHQIPKARVKDHNILKQFFLQKFEINSEYVGAVAADTSFFDLKIFDYNACFHNLI